MSGKKKMILAIDFIALILLVWFDQFTKKLAVVHLKDQQAFPIIPDVFELQYLENRGAAFGMLQNQKWFFIIVAAVILCAICYVLIKVPEAKKYTAIHILLTAIGAGAIGNMIDRFMYDYVVDFFYFKLIDFPIFNVADIYVTVSTAFIVIFLLFIYKEDDLEFINSKKKNQ